MVIGGLSFSLVCVALRRRRSRGAERRCKAVERCAQLWWASLTTTTLTLTTHLSSRERKWPGIDIFPFHKCRFPVTGRCRRRYFFRASRADISPAPEHRPGSVDPRSPARRKCFAIAVVGLSASHFRRRADISGATGPIEGSISESLGEPVVRLIPPHFLAEGAGGGFVVDDEQFDAEYFRQIG